MLVARTLVAGGLLIATAEVASGATLYSPPVSLQNGEALECKITNLDTKPHEVEIMLLTDAGGPVPDIVDPPVTVDPGESVASSRSAGECFTPPPVPPLGTCFPVRCVFEVDAGKNKVRASACVQVGGSCVTALEAR